MENITGYEIEKSLGDGFKLAFYRARKSSISRHYFFKYRGLTFEVFMDTSIYITIYSIYDMEGCLIAQVNDDNIWSFGDNNTSKDGEH